MTPHGFRGQRQSRDSFAARLDNRYFGNPPGPARDDAKAREEFLSVMASEADRMVRLVDALLSLSKIEMRAHAAPNQTEDIFVIVREVVSDI